MNVALDSLSMVGPVTRLLETPLDQELTNRRLAFFAPWDNLIAQVMAR